MEDLVKHVDDAIAQYRRQLEAEAELAESDLDELEAHLRDLAEELRTAGKPALEAVAEAARRLGDPRELAREHARVRTPFGSPLSRSRALSAATIFVIPLIVGMLTFIGAPNISMRVWFELGALGVVAIALAARVTWARAIVLGATLQSLALLLLAPAAPDPLYLMCEVGVLAFVAPWRWNEISTAALALALQIWAYGAAAVLLTLQFTAGENGDVLLGPTCATITLICTATGCVASVLRARWSAFASALSAIALFVACGELFMMNFRFDNAFSWQLYLFGAVSTGAVAATVAAVLSWRTTPSLRGTLKYVLR